MKQPNWLTEKLIESLSGNSHLRNTMRTATPPEQRMILSAWYNGYVSVFGNQTVQHLNFPAESTFIDTALPEVKQAVAA